VGFTRFMATASVKKCAPALTHWISNDPWPGRGDRMEVLGFTNILATAFVNKCAPAL
jgi:hypothetical protein